MRWKQVLFAALLVCGVTAQSYGQAITVSFFQDGQPIGQSLSFAPAQAIFLTPSNVPSGATLARVSSSLPGNSTSVVGPITVTVGEALNILVGGTFLTTMPERDDRDAPVGAFAFTGLTYTNHSARDASSLGVWLAFADDGSISSTITGTIDVGRVVRLQAGSMNATLTATRIDNIRLTGELAGSVNASFVTDEFIFQNIPNAIEDINISRGVSDGSIDLDSIGIRADILAPNGRIGSIGTDGSIGSSRRVTLSAQRFGDIGATSFYPDDRLDRSTAVDSTVVPRLLNAHVVTARRASAR